MCRTEGSGMLAGNGPTREFELPTADELGTSKGSVTWTAGRSTAGLEDGATEAVLSGLGGAVRPPIALTVDTGSAATPPGALAFAMGFSGGGTREISVVDPV